MKKFIISFVFIFTIFTFQAFSAVKTWDGGGSDNNWTTAANWVNDVAPVANDDLVFPLTATQLTTNNNFFILTNFNSITIDGSYTIGGNPLRLANGLSVTSGTQAINTAISLNGVQTFTGGQASITTIAVLSVGNFGLTFDGAGSFGIGLISGSGAITKNGLGATLLATASGFNGAITHNNGIFVNDAATPNSTITVNAGTLGGGELGFSGFGGTGTVGTVNVTQGVISAGTLTSPTGILNTGNLTFTPNGNYAVKIGGTTAGQTGHDQLNITGTVSLNNARLAPIPWNGFQPAIGDSFIILRNDGADAINGTFFNAPEGSVFGGALNTAFRISYQGGDGNDVVITRVNRATYDFEGDGKADVSVFRPSNGVWFQLLSFNGNIAAPSFGLSTDKLVPADYDGDNKTDIAVFRPSNGVWYMLRSSDSTFSFTQFGTVEDIPVPNDFDGDGRADLSVFRPSVGTWYQIRSIANQFFAQQFGQTGDLPQIGDFDGDGLGDLVVYRNGIWHQFLSETDAYSAVSFGISTDKPVPADFDGDAQTDFAVYRDGVWFQLNSTQGFQAISFGIASDKPVPADFDGDGKTDVAVYRGGIWYRLRSTAGFDAVSFGNSTDQPIPGVYQ